MILISYIAPNINVQSDRLISGNLIIKNKQKQVIRSSQFSDIEYLNVKVKSSWPKSVWVTVVTKGNETTKIISI